eukprot:6975149-Pyramimonas_sp.AAC.1
MSANIARRAQVSKKYKVTARVERQGSLSAGSYGHQIHGAFGHAVTAFRRRQGHACAASSSGRCLTTLLALQGEKGDPGITMAVDCIKL